MILFFASSSSVCFSRPCGCAEFTPEEDSRLVELVQQFGEKNWGEYGDIFLDAVLKNVLKDIIIS